MSFAIFMNETAIVLSAPEASTMASWAARASNCRRRRGLACEPRRPAMLGTYLVRGSVEGVTGDRRDLGSDLNVETLLRVEALESVEGGHQLQAYLA